MSHKSKSQIIDSRRKLRPAAIVCVCVIQKVCSLCMCANLCVYVYACTYVCLCMCLMESVYLSVYLYVIEKACGCVRILRICVRSRVQEREKYKIVHVVDKLWSVRLSVNHFT